MASSRVARGRRTQECVAQWFREHGSPGAQSLPASLPGRDITGMPAEAPEVKARRDFHPRQWARQAAKNAGGDLPYVVMRPDGMGEESVAEWPVFLTLEEFTRLKRAAGYGDPE